jgi:hypothetical protein
MEQLERPCLPWLRGSSAACRARCRTPGPTHSFPHCLRIVYQYTTHSAALHWCPDCLLREHWYTAAAVSAVQLTRVLVQVHYEQTV